jgi:MYXO-CTERM domain-containing protein
MKQLHVQRVRIAGALLLALGLAMVSGSVYAQGDNPPVESTQTTQQDTNDFPWGLLGLLGLGGLAGLRRREAPLRLETIDASRRA